MGGFPENESMAYAVISWGSAMAALSGATKVIVKTPHEASGIPTMQANKQGLDATTQLLNMVREQVFPASPVVDQEVELIKREVRAVLDKVFELGNGDVAVGAVRAFEAGVIDVPFAPAACNAGKLLPVRDNEGAVRIFEIGRVPLPDDVLAYHKEKIAERAKAENRAPAFQMVVDDIYAISKSKLIGRPR
jgi:methylaspartate mutase epsilon subunit